MRIAAAFTALILAACAAPAPTVAPSSTPRPATSVAITSAAPAAAAPLPPTPTRAQSATSPGLTPTEARSAAATAAPATVVLLPTVTVAAALTPAQAPATTPTPTRIVTLRGASGARQIRVEIADTDASRQLGLMHRTSMPEDAGMLFVFPTDIQGGFWMKDTLIPLSIAFIAADGRIVHITDMQPQTLDIHMSPLPYRYALETNQGYFGRAGITVGDRAEIGS